MHRNSMSQFPLTEQNIANEGVPVFKYLPDGVTEYEHSVPRQATGTHNRRFTYCDRCKGWISGGPFIQNKAQTNTPFGKVGASNIYRCVRCGFPLECGVLGGREKKNTSGIGTEGTLRP